MTRFNFQQAKRICGLERDFQLRRPEDYETALRAWKERMVGARRTGNHDLAALLSQCKQVIKRRFNWLFSRTCPDCGRGKQRHAARCFYCSLVYRHYRNKLPYAMKEHELGELALIPPRMQATGILTAVCRKLALNGQVGDCFITDKQPTSVKNVCRLLGMEVIIRIADIHEKDRKKRRWRVWRSDGLGMEQVNERIEARMAGKTVPVSPPCKPLPPDALPPRHKQRTGRGQPPA
jgi:hypothetical protein